MSITQMNNSLSLAIKANLGNHILATCLNIRLRTAQYFTVNITCAKNHRCDPGGPCGKNTGADTKMAAQHVSDEQKNQTPLPQQRDIKGTSSARSAGASYVRSKEERIAAFSR